jgi:hypothetical protein
VANHRAIVGQGFRIGGWLLGVPSLVVLLVICLSLFILHPEPDKSAYVDVGTYGLAGLLANGAHAVGALFRWLGGIAAWIEKTVAIGLIVLIGFAACLYVTGKGIDRHSRPARIAAFAIAMVFLFFWLLMLLSLSRHAMVLPAVGAAVSLYTIWVLGWRYT